MGGRRFDDAAMSVLIIGGGIGGLAAAVALRRAGIAARVFERAPQISEVGASLSIFSNAVKALRRMGLEDQVLSLGPEVVKARFLSTTGQVLSSIDVEDISRDCGAASVVVHRADLQQMLLNALDADQVATGKECVGVVQDEDGVTVRFADRTEARGQIAIGADGIRSTVSTSLFGEEGLRSAGYYCYRAMAATPDVPTCIESKCGAVAACHACWYCVTNFIWTWSSPGDVLVGGAAPGTAPDLHRRGSRRRLPTHPTGIRSLSECPTEDARRPERKSTTAG